MSRWILIDGYSLLHRDPELAPLLPRDLQTARQRLVRKLEAVVDRLAEKTTLVFDGWQSGADEALSSPTLDVRFSPGHATADTVIERMVFAAPRPADLLVVTSDRSECETVAAAGAAVMSCAQFLDLCRQQRGALRDRAARGTPGGPTLGDFFPDRSG